MATRRLRAFILCNGTRTLDPSFCRRAPALPKRGCKKLANTKCTPIFDHRRLDTAARHGSQSPRLCLFSRAGTKTRQACGTSYTTVPYFYVWPQATTHWMIHIMLTTPLLVSQTTVRTLATVKPTRDLRTRLLAASAGMDDAESRDLNHFIDLLERCLTLNPEKRLVPADALKHPFFTQRVHGYGHGHGHGR